MIIPGLLIVIILSYGLTYLEIQTDPVELWTPPGSRARQERDYFHEKFGSLYRVEQIIITGKNIPPVQYNTTKGHVVEYGPILNKTFMRQILELQNRIKALKTGTGITLSDVCFKPLAPENENCMILSYLGWWQDDPEKMNKITANKDTGDMENYLDHFVYCSENQYSSSCFGPYGGPVDPTIALGGYNQDHGEPNFFPHATISIERMHALPIT